MKNPIKYTIPLIIIAVLIFFSLRSTDTIIPKSLFTNTNDETTNEIVCSLTQPDLLDRKADLQTAIFSKVVETQESEYGYIFFFKDENNMLETLTDYILGEQKCCPFFSYNISIRSYNKGIALEVSGPKAAKILIRNFIANI